MGDLRLRVRAVLDEYDSVLLGVLLVCCLVGAAVTYGVYVAPGVETTERVAATWEADGQFTHRGVVTRANALHDRGATLPNRSVYVDRIAPRLEGAYRFEGTGGLRDVDGSLTLALVLRGVQGAGTENRSVAWRTSERLAERDLSAAMSNGTAAVPFALNVSTLENRTARIRDDIGEQTGTAQVLVVATVNATGTLDGAPVEHDAREVLRVSLDEDTYRVRSTGNASAAFASRETVTRPRSYGALRRLLGPLLLVVGAGGIGALALARRRGGIALSDAERERLAYLGDRERFDEWISTIELPPQAFELPEAEAASLGGLVDFAIDTDNGVVESPDGAAFHVVHDGYLYTYRPPVLDDPDEFETASEDVTADGAESLDSFDFSILDGDDPSEDDSPSAVASDSAED